MSTHATREPYTCRACGEMVTFLCERCNAEIQPDRTNYHEHRRFCSNACRQAAYRARKAKAWREEINRDYPGSKPRKGARR